MIALRRSEPRAFDVACTVEISHTFESLHAHVVLDGDIRIRPGDEVTVHGAPIRVPYGETASIRRNATIRRAGWLEREWTRMTGDVEFMELLEFSFSSESEL
ncbi:hypothetical protein [Amorphus orientalis]|uniref:Uncharacterized protein n=1 Tax=Amorphus orientalis TaxID=649198 RepID=A0AAE3VNY4_9HYPH|nr:hypothetical protein [Amorphus orientalis]MDQ0315455.1 hypothetical protein [Amorphus orientalis]